MSFPSSKEGRQMQRIFIFSYWLVKLLPSVCATSLNGLNLLIGSLSPQDKHESYFVGLRRPLVQALPTSKALAAGADDQLWHSAPITLGPATGKELWEKALGETSWGSSPVFRLHAPLAWTPWDVALRGPLPWLPHCPSAPRSPSLAEQPHCFNSLTSSKGNSDLPLHYIKCS